LLARALEKCKPLSVFFSFFVLERREENANRESKRRQHDKRKRDQLSLAKTSQVSPTRKTSSKRRRLHFSPWPGALVTPPHHDPSLPPSLRSPILVRFHCLAAGPPPLRRVQAATFGHEHDAGKPAPPSSAEPLPRAPSPLVPDSQYPTLSNWGTGRIDPPPRRPFLYSFPRGILEPIGNTQSTNNTHSITRAGN
jgi:hypothetical protein